MSKRHELVRDNPHWMFGCTCGEGFDTPADQAAHALENMRVAEIGDEHRNHVWRDRNGDYWQWYDDGERRGWKYQSPHNRWRFGGMHIPACGPFTFVSKRIDNPT